MVLEHERTFLAKELPTGLEEAPKKEMVDIYLPTTGHHPVLRVRRNGDKYRITKKEITNEEKKVFREQTIEITKEEFDELNANLRGKRVEKTRYYYPWQGHTLEIGVHHGPLAGFVSVEIEFPDGEGMDDFTMPAFCLVEVTGQEWKAGGYLAGRTYEDIKPHLDKLGYKKLG